MNSLHSIILFIIPYEGLRRLRYLTKCKYFLDNSDRAGDSNTLLLVVAHAHLSMAGGRLIV